MQRLLPLVALVAIPWGPTPRAAAQPGAGLFRGQDPAPGALAAWGPTYLAPGELSCDTPPPRGLGYELGAPPGVIVGPPPGAFPAPTTLLPKAPQTDPAATADPGWFDVLPADGGPISDDFGLPTQPKVENRVPNPLYVRGANPDAVWEIVAREASRYYPIGAEERLRESGGLVTEGRLETQWGSGSTIFEPWRRDSVGAFNRWQSTLQTIRRRVVIRALPAAGGYELDVRVDKQLEDLNRPERASAGAASLRNDSALPTDRLAPIDPVLGSGRWIDIGRDEALEQRILTRLGRQLGGTG